MEYFLFALQGKTGKIGYLVVKGMPQEHHEKFTILGSSVRPGFAAYQTLSRDRARRGHRQSDRIAHASLHDRAFPGRAEAFPGARHEIVFLMVDVDHFKTFNDQYGHLMGDQILREVGKRIQESTREIDIAGRFGGEEFCVVLPDTDRAGARYAAERIRQAVEAGSIKAYDAEVKITLSLGVATYPEDGARIEELTDKADWALYRAKREGRNRVCAFGIYD